MNDTELLESIKAGLLKVVRDFSRECSDTMVGIALCTDDELRTLLCHVLGETDLSPEAEEDLLFCPTDWPFCRDSPAFDLAIRELQLRSEVRSDIRRDFFIMVAALSELKAEGVIAKDVYASVLSTDPGPETEALREESVAALNAESVVESRRAFISNWE